MNSLWGDGGECWQRKGLCNEEDGSFAVRETWVSIPVPPLQATPRELEISKMQSQCLAPRDTPQMVAAITVTEFCPVSSVREQTFQTSQGDSSLFSVH